VTEPRIQATCCTEILFRECGESCLFYLKSASEGILNESGSIFKQKFENRAVNENLSQMPISNETSSSRRNPSADWLRERSSTQRGGAELENKQIWAGHMERPAC
jgi:hypothetical protein